MTSSESLNNYKDARIEALERELKASINRELILEKDIIQLINIK